MFNRSYQKEKVLMLHPSLILIVASLLRNFCSLLFICIFNIICKGKLNLNSENIALTVDNLNSMLSHHTEKIEKISLPVQPKNLV